MFNSLIKPIYSLMNKSKNNGEMQEDSIVWRDFLFGIVPVERLSQSLRRAIQKQTGSFAPNFFDIKNAWLEIAAQEREAAKEQELRDNPAAACPSVKYHVGDTAQTIEMNPHTQENELYPCPNCRTEDYENKKKTDIALYGEIKPIITFEQIASVGKSLESDCACGHPFHAGQQCRVKKASGKFCECWNYQKKKPVEEISTEEAAALAAEHNDLVRQIAKDAAKDLLIVWDEGANCFARANYRARTFSAEVVKKAIADYRRILAGENL